MFSSSNDLNCTIIHIQEMKTNGPHYWFWYISDLWIVTWPILCTASVHRPAIMHMHAVSRRGVNRGVCAFACARVSTSSTAHSECRQPINWYIKRTRVSGASLAWALACASRDTSMLNISDRARARVARQNVAVSGSPLSRVGSLFHVNRRCTTQFHRTD